MSREDNRFPSSHTLTEKQVKSLFPIVKYVVDTYQKQTDLTANGMFIQINDQTDVETIIITLDKHIGELIKSLSDHTYSIFHFYRVGDTKIGVKFTKVDKSRTFDDVVNTLDKTYLNRQLKWHGLFI